MSSYIAVVDVGTHHIEGHIPVGKRSLGIALSRDEKTLYGADGLRDDITLVDLNKREPTSSLPIGRVPWGIVADD